MLKTKIAAAAILKITKIATFPQLFVRSIRNLAWLCKMGLLTVLIVKKLNFLKSKKPLNRHISATVWPILMKFGTVTRICLPTGDRSLKFGIFQKPRWRQPPSWKTTKIAISQQRIDRSSWNLARLCKMGHLTSQSGTEFAFLKPRMAERKQQPTTEGDTKVLVYKMKCTSRSQIQTQEIKKSKYKCKNLTV